MEMDAIVQRRGDTEPTTIPPRVFVPEDAGKAFGADFLDKEACRRWILAAIHGAGVRPRCPRCQVRLDGTALQSFWEGRRIRCRTCGKFFTARAGTFLAGCHLSYGQVMLLAALLNFEKIKDQEIACVLKISQESVRIWRNKYEALRNVQRLQKDTAWQEPEYA